MRDSFKLPNPLALDDALSLSLSPLRRSQCRAPGMRATAVPSSCLSPSICLPRPLVLNQFDIKPSRAETVELSVSLKKKWERVFFRDAAGCQRLWPACSEELVQTHSHMACRLPRPYAGERLNFISTFSLHFLSLGKLSLIYSWKSA